MQRTATLVWLLPLLALIAGVGYGLYQPTRHLANNYQVIPPTPIAQFQLLTHSGERFTPGKLRGRWSLLFSGYTRCPDVCPATLSLLSQARRDFAITLKSETPQLVFLTIDPTHDNKTELERYLGYFPAPITGVTGTSKQLNLLLKSIGFYPVDATAEIDTSKSLAHSATVALVNPSGELAALIRAPFDLQALKDQVQRTILSR